MVDPQAAAMPADENLDAVVRFYDNHPINEQQIMGALAARGIAPDSISEDQLQEFDQDHYGGVPALARLATEAGIGRQHHVLDICSGMGGPARVLAHTFGCRVTGIEGLETYATRLEDNGCTVLQRTDLSGEWRRILRERLAMYRSLRDSTIAKFGVDGYARYDAAYSFFVSLYEDGILGGVRYVAVRNGMLKSAHDPRS